VTHSWNDPDTHDLWTLTASERVLLPGRTDTGQLGCAVQLNFMEVHGRFPEQLDEVVSTIEMSRVVSTQPVSSVRADGMQVGTLFKAGRSIHLNDLRADSRKTALR
jgi:hypothetical protein